MTADLKCNKLRLRQRGHCDQSAVFYIASRARIFFPDIRGRECRQITMGFCAAEMKTADHELEIQYQHLRGKKTSQNVRVAGSKSAIHGGGDIATPGKLIEVERIFGKKGDVDDILPVLDNGSERVEAHISGYGGDHQIRIADDIAHGFGTAEISDAGVYPIAGRQGFKRSMI